VRRTAGKPAATDPSESKTRRQATLLKRLLPAVAGLFTFFALLTGSALAVTPTLEAHFTGPEGGTARHLAVNEQTGEIFVLDEAKEAIDRYTSAGVLVEEIAGSFGFNYREFAYDKIAVDNSGGQGQGDLYASSLDGERIFAFRLEAGVYKEVWEVRPGYLPTGVAVDKSGNPWFTVSYEHLAVELNPVTGLTEKKIETSGVEDDSIAFDSEDHMFVTAHYEAKVVEYDPVTGEGLSAISIVHPEDIAIDPITNRRFVTTENWLEIMTSGGAVVGGTPFFASSEAVAVNGAARKVYTASNSEVSGNEVSGNEIKVWRLPGVLPLTVTKIGGGSSSVVSAPSGIDCGSVCGVSFDEGETVTLTAVPESGLVVSGWKGCAYEPGPDECEVTVDQASEVTVSFAKAADLTVSKSGPGTVTSTPASIKCGVHCSAAFPEGATVVLAANVPPGDSVAWHGCMAQPTASECEVTLNAARSVSASFSPIMYSLAIARSGSGSGTVTCNGASCLAEYPVGSTIELGGSAASGSAFVGFSGAGCSETTCDLVLGGNVSVTAAFNYVLSAGAVVPSAPTLTPLLMPVSRSKPVVKTGRCRQGYVRRRVNGGVRCVKVKQHGKSKKHR
jgi:hypothetical protein